MNLKPNKHKRISFNKTTMASLGFIPPSPTPQVPLNYFGLNFLGPPPLKLKAGGYHVTSICCFNRYVPVCKKFNFTPAIFFEILITILQFDWPGAFLI